MNHVLFAESHASMDDGPSTAGCNVAVRGDAGYRHKGFRIDWNHMFPNPFAIVCNKASLSDHVSANIGAPH